MERQEWLRVDAHNQVEQFDSLLAEKESYLRCLGPQNLFWKDSMLNGRQNHLVDAGYGREPCQSVVME